ncbi:MAG: hypothetical protein U0T81_13270 [Saprospiraceae bacterium]
MKKLLLLMLVASAWEIRAQITINNSILPSVGDVYNYAVDTVSSGITITASGGNQGWDFSKLARHRTTSVKFVDPSGQGSASFQAPILLQRVRAKILFMEPFKILNY